MADDDQSEWPAGQRDYPPGALMWEEVTYVLNTQEPGDRWMGPVGANKRDRDEMTRVQAFRADKYPDEKRRVIRVVEQYWVDEIEGDGEGETSRDELFARNQENTDRRIAKQKAKAAEQATS